MDRSDGRRVSHWLLAGRYALLEVLFLLAAQGAFGQQIASLGRAFPGSPIFSYDADGAVGPSHYAEITNRGLRVTALSSGSVVYDSTLRQFWGSKCTLKQIDVGE